jgi:hypothetical protein
MLAKVHTTSFLYIDVNGLGAVVKLVLQKYIVYVLVEIVLANCVIWENNCRGVCILLVLLLVVF